MGGGGGRGDQLGQCSCVRSPERSMSCSDIGLPQSGQAGGRSAMGSSS